MELLLDDGEARPKLLDNATYDFRRTFRVFSVVEAVMLIGHQLYWRAPGYDGQTAVGPWVYGEYWLNHGRSFFGYLAPLAKADWVVFVSQQNNVDPIE
jgi:hypothetical protein